MIIYPHNPAESATEYAYRVLQKNIIHMLLPPGTAISPVEVATELKISRTPLQSACAHLASERLLTIFPQKGSYVSLIDLQRVYESIYLRNILDQAAVRHLCSDAKWEEALLALNANLNQQEFRLKTSDTDEIIELDNQFHNIIYNMSGMSNLQVALSSISADQDRVRCLKMNSKIQMYEAVSEHRELLSAIKAQDQDLAAELSYKHISKFAADVTAIYNENPSYFSNWDENIWSNFVCQKQIFYHMNKV